MTQIRDLGGGRYQGIVYTGIDPVSGKRQRYYENFKAANDKAADAYGRKLQKKHGAKRRGTTAVTLGDLLEEWYEGKKRSLAMGTRESYEGNINASKPLHKVPLGKLTARDLDSLYRKLESEGISSATIRKVHARIHQALDMALRYELVERNVADLAEPPAVKSKLTRPPTVDELITLLDGCKYEEERTFMFLSVATGARAGELGALRWRDVDFDRRTVHFTAALTTDEEGKVEIKDTKTHEQRLVPIAPETVEILKYHHERVEAAAEKCEIALTDACFVFSPSPASDHPYRSDSLTQRFIRLRNRVGIPDVRLHDMRHFSITQMMNAGIDVKTVSTLHGHSRHTTTPRYTHQVGTHDREAAEVVAGMITRRSGTAPAPSEE